MYRGCFELALVHLGKIIADSMEDLTPLRKEVVCNIEESRIIRISGFLEESGYEALSFSVRPIDRL